MRYQHKYYQTVREEQREAFRDECQVETPKRKPITGKVFKYNRANGGTLSLMSKGQRR